MPLPVIEDTRTSYNGLDPIQKYVAKDEAVYQPESVDIETLNSSVTANKFLDWTFGALGEGATIGAESFPAAIGGMVRYTSGQMEHKPVKQEELLKDLAIPNPFMQNIKFGKQMLTGGAELMSEDYEGMLEDIDSFGKTMVEDNREYILEKYGMPENKVDQFFRDLGQGFYSMGEALLLGFTTGGPGVLAWFGAREAGSKYGELKDAGVPVDKALTWSTISGVMEGGIESVSTIALTRLPVSGWLSKGGLGASLEGSEEFLQNLSSESISLIAGSKEWKGKETVLEVLGSSLYAGVIGTLVGGPTGIGLAASQHAKIRGVYEELGDSKKVAKQKADKAFKGATEAAINDLETELVVQKNVQRSALIKAAAKVELTQEEETALLNLEENYRNQGLLKEKEEKAPSKQRIAKSIQEADMQAAAAQLNMTVEELRAMQSDYKTKRIKKLEQKIEQWEKQKNDDAVDVSEARKQVENLKLERKTFLRAISQEKTDEKSQAQLKDLDAKYKNKEGESLETIAKDNGFKKVKNFIDYLTGLDRTINKAEEYFKTQKAAQQNRSFLKKRKSELDVVKKEVKGFLAGEKKGEVIARRRIRKAQMGLDKIIKKMFPLKGRGRDLNAKQRAKISTILRSVDGDPKKLFNAVEKLEGMLREKLERQARREAQAKILKTYKKPEKKIAADFQSKVDNIQRELGRTKKEQVKSLKNMSTKELISLAREVTNYLNEGKKQQQRKDELSSLASDIMEAALIKQAGGLTRTENAPGTQAYVKEVKKNNVFHKLDWAAKRPIYVLRNLFGEDIGVKWLYDSFDIAESKEMISRAERLSRIQESYIKHGIDEKTMNKRVSLGNKNLAINEILRLYVAQFESDSWQAIKRSIFDNDEDLMNEYIQYLEDNYSEYGKFAKEVQEEVASKYDDIAKTMEDIFNINMKKVENYFPLFRIYLKEHAIDKAGESFAHLVFEDAQRNKGYDHSAVNKQFTISRQDVQEARGKPVNMDFFGSAHKIIDSQEHFLNKAILERTVNKLRNSLPLKETIEARFGLSAWNAFEDYLKVQIDTREMYSNRNPYLHKARKYIAVGFLGFNVVTAMKQFPSIILALKWTNPATLMNSFFDVLTDKNYREAILQKDPTLRVRSIDRTLGEFKARGAQLSENETLQKLQLARRQIGENAFKMIMSVDSRVVMSVYDAVYKHQRATKSEAEARDIAHKAVIKTQPQANVKDLPQLYRTNDEYVRMLLLFTNQLNQIWQLIREETTYDIKTGDKEAAMTTIGALLLDSFLIYMISHGFKWPEDDEEQAAAFFDAIFGSAVASIPIFGNAFTGIVRGYEPADTPLASVAKSITWGLKGLASGDPERIMNATMDLSVLAGVPVSQPKRFVKGLIDMKKKETEDPRRLIWSKYSLFE